MPEVIRGTRSNSQSHMNTDLPLNSATSPASPISPDRRVTFEQSRREETSASLPNIAAPNQQAFSPRRSTQSTRRHSSHHYRRSNSREFANDEERAAYYDSRAASHRNYNRRGSTLQSYYHQHPELLPQLPFTFRHGFKRWKLAGYVAMMVFDACVVPILLYYSLTFGGSVQGFITFAVITAIWGGPTYVEFAVRSLRLIRKENFYKPLGVDRKWVFDITNWILVLTIAVVTALLIVGAAPHIVFLRVLSMPGPAILYCLSGSIFLMTLYSACGWKAPFRISSTAKGEKVLPGIYYIAEDIVSVNAGGGRPFREGWAARYNASPLFRKMIRDQSWFWSVSGLIVATACTVVVVINEVPEPVSYGIGWGVPFLWAGIWAAITLPWVRSVMAHERRSWEEDSAILDDIKKEPSSGPAPNAPDPTAAVAAIAPASQTATEKASDASTLRGSEQGRGREQMTAQDAAATAASTENINEK